MIVHHSTQHSNYAFHGILFQIVEGLKHFIYSNFNKTFNVSLSHRVFNNMLKSNCGVFDNVVLILFDIIGKQFNEQICIYNSILEATPWTHVI